MNPPDLIRPTLVVIAAVARDGAIGRGNELLWHESEDQKHFRRVTMGCPVIMGRRTWDSLPERFRPLPGRRNLVVTRQATWHATGAEPVPSLDAALALVHGVPKVFVIGGGQLYAEAVPRADELELTEVEMTFPDADTHFPAWPRAGWAEVAREPRVSASGVPYAFVTYRRHR